MRRATVDECPRRSAREFSSRLTSTLSVSTNSCDVVAGGAARDGIASVRSRRVSVGGAGFGGEGVRRRLRRLRDDAGSAGGLRTGLSTGHRVLPRERVVVPEDR